LWKESAPELMGAELLICLCWLSDCEELVGVTHRRWWGYRWKFWAL